MSHTFEQPKSSQNQAQGQAQTQTQSQTQTSRLGRNRSFDRNRREGDLTALAKAFDKAVEDTGNVASVFRFTQVPTTDGIRLPILAIWAKYGQSIYAYGYTLWNGETIQDYVAENSTIRIPRFAGDCCDQIAANAMIARIRRDAGVGAEVPVVPVALAVISSEVKFDNENQIQDLLFTAGNAIETSAEQRRDLPADVTTIDSLRSATGKLQASISYGNSNITNLFSLPTRADVRIEVTQTAGNQNKNNLHGSDELLTVVDGYFEPSFAPQELKIANFHTAQNALNVPGLPAPKLNRAFLMTFVITNFDYIGSQGAVTLESKLLALASVSAILRTDFQWAEAYRNTYGQANPWRNIGALAREVPALTDSKSVPGKAVDAHQAKFGVEELTAFVDQVCWPQLALAIDVDENGPWSWLESTLIQATGAYDEKDNGISTRARKYITGKLDALTGNRFSGKMPADKPLFLPQTFRLHRGYFELDGRGILDIRELGLLELLNAGNDLHSYENAIEYAKTFEEFQRPEYERQAKRLEIFQQTLGGGKNIIKVVGNTRRIFLSTEFVSALLASTGEAGLSYQGEPLRINGLGSSNRGAQYLNGAILAANLGFSHVNNPTVVGGASVGYAAPISTNDAWA